MIAIIDQQKAAIIQIATPYSFGTGFYLKKYDLIVTNEHIVRDADSVVVVGSGFEKQLVRVLFWDAKLNLAFLEGPKGSDLWSIELNVQPIEIGAKVLAMGHSFGNDFACETGTIANLEYEQENIFCWRWTTFGYRWKSDCD
jgi:serine protease Do